MVPCTKWCPPCSQTVDPWSQVNGAPLQLNGLPLRWPFCRQMVQRATIWSLALAARWQSHCLDAIYSISPHTTIFGAKMAKRISFPYTYFSGFYLQYKAPPLAKFGVLFAVSPSFCLWMVALQSNGGLLQPSQLQPYGGPLQNTSQPNGGPLQPSPLRTIIWLQGT